MQLSVRARVTNPVTEEEREAAGKAGLIIRGTEDMRTAAEIGFRLSVGEDPSTKIETFLGLLGPRYGDSLTHAILRKKEVPQVRLQ